MEEILIPETRKGLDFHLDPCEFVVGRAGFEPATNGLKVCYAYHPSSTIKEN